MTLTAPTATDEFAQLYSASFARIAGQLHAYLGDHSEAQDLTQEAFCRAFDRWTRVGGLADPAGWVRRVAWNLATSRLRHLQAAKRYLFSQRTGHVDGPSPDRVALIRALATLPPKHRLALVLHYIGNLSTSEIAQQCDVAEGTVRSWLTRGRERLAEHFRDPQWTVQAGPATPGVEDVVSTVRRRRVVRRSALAVLVVLALAVPVMVWKAREDQPPIIEPTPVPSRTFAPQAISACAGRLLPTPGNAASRISGGDPTGRYLVGTVEVDEIRPALWHDGTLTAISVSGQISGLAVNSQGVVVGSSDNGFSGYKLWMFRDNRLEIIAATDDQREAMRLIGINNRGDVLVDIDGTPAILSGGALRRLALPPGVRSASARGLAEDGSVVATSAMRRLLVWSPGGEARELAVPQGWEVIVQEARGEWAISMDPFGNRIVRWNLRSGEHTELANLAEARNINAHGWVLAQTASLPTTAPGQETRGGRPLVVMDGQRLELSAPTTLSSPAAAFISDDGRVIAGHVYAGDLTRAALWACQ